MKKLLVYFLTVQAFAANVIPGDKVLLPLPTSVSAGTTNFLREDGSWQAPPITRTISVVFDGGGSAISNTSAFYYRLPYAFTATKWTVIASTSTSITFTIAVDDWSTSTLPTTDVIGAHTAPALSTAIGATATPDWSDVSWADGQVVKIGITGTPTSVWAILIIEGITTE